MFQKLCRASGWAVTTLFEPTLIPPLEARDLWGGKKEAVRSQEEIIYLTDVPARGLASPTKPRWKSKTDIHKETRVFHGVMK